jgi:hypothetical protein
LNSSSQGSREESNALGLKERGCLAKQHGPSLGHDLMVTRAFFFFVSPIFATVASLSYKRSKCILLPLALPSNLLLSLRKINKKPPETELLITTKFKGVFSWEVPSVRAWNGIIDSK